jgi:hypothetical protein
MRVLDIVYNASTLSVDPADLAGQSAGHSGKDLTVSLPVDPWPDFFIAGAPKAGTTALHAALVGVDGVQLSRVKEPKFFLCDGRPPAREQHRGPGDAHSRQEWVWRTSDYLGLWSPDRGGLRGPDGEPRVVRDPRGDGEGRSSVEQLGDQVVGAVGTGELVVQPAGAARLVDHRDVAQGAVGAG